MERNNLHDEIIDRLVDRIRSLLRPQQGLTVLTHAWWKVPQVIPIRAFQFDIAVIPGTSSTWIEDDKTWLVELNSLTAIDVLRSGNHHEYFDKPNELCETSIREYCLIDSTRTFMRPSLEAHRRTQGVFRRVRTSADEVFFSVCGFALEARTSEAWVRSCGQAVIEEKLFKFQHCLTQAEKRRDQSETEVAGLRKAIAGLEERLASRQAEDDE